MRPESASGTKPTNNLIGFDSPIFPDVLGNCSDDPSVRKLKSYFRRSYRKISLDQPHYTVGCRADWEDACSDFLQAVDDFGAVGVAVKSGTRLIGERQPVT